MKLFLSVCVVALVAGIAVADDSKGPKVTEKVFFDITIDGKPTGRIEIGLFGKTVPKTVKIFREQALKPAGEGYKGSMFHFIRKGLMIKGGGYGTERPPLNVYDDDYDDENENTKLREYDAGWLFMDNDGKFFINTKEISLVGERPVFFGKILSGMNVVRQIENLPTYASGLPIKDVVIANSGSIPVPEAKADATD
ncbi:peptidyl-prolyl cis-trans isomerase 5-like [Drosophila rhopaloa]|uniref:Peptidyl-prolyl cis-trans isomerase n=1 Tax=Drosophila rhopaloa TaxID=1041015 RepID=A0A6P4EDW5_DRORH|nr:peptidyl-prolyl cis-trans isomerase 5-like [Drosophila rhopaloa]